MQLYYTPTSPYVRKVMVTAHELGIALETITLRPAPTNPDPVLSRANPLSKIPALVLDDGATLYDSPVICDYLDSLGAGTRLVPADGPERWRVLRLQALADGVLDAGVLVFYETTQRPVELRWEPWLAGQSAKIRQGLDALEREAPGFSGIDLGQIAAAVAIGWLAFRGVGGDPLAGRPALARWYEGVARRDSMLATAPHA
jgi:glutathione S-transferase